MTVNKLNNVLFTGISAIDGRTRSTLSAINGQTISAFSPLDIASIDWWLTADSFVLNDGDAVTTWVDSSGAGKDYTQATAANKPTYKIVNGHPVVTFATNDKLGPSPSRNFLTLNTMIVVCTPSSTANSYIWGGAHGGGTPAFISGFSSKAFEYYNGGSERATFATTTSGLHILTLTRAETGNAVGYFDGASAFSTAIDGGNNWNGSEVSEIGANGAGGGDDFFNGDIAQMFHFNAILTSTELNNMHNYLGAEYGITVTPI